MTQFLPPNLLSLFTPRDPIPYLPPVDKLPYQKKTSRYSGLSDFLSSLDNPLDKPPPKPTETKLERQERKRREKAEQVVYKLEQDIALWRPKENPASTSDPYKTLFVARVNYDTSEAKLKREFEKYGKIRKICIIHKKEDGKPRGYAFIEYDRARDMHSAYKHADGKKIDGRRVLVDVERGRTVTGWLPRRLGGGLGGTRRGGFDVNLKHSGREEQRSDDRYLNRDRDRAERPERVRSRSRSRERRRRSRSRSRDRHRSDRHKRDRSHDRERTRDHDGNAGLDKADGINEVKPEAPVEGEPREKRRRSRSRDRDRKRSSRRSRSRERKHREYDRDRDSRRERDRPRDQDDRMIMAATATEEPRNNEEPTMPEIQTENFDNGYEDEYNAYNANSLEYM